MITPTEYKLEKSGNNIKVMKNGVIQAQGFDDEESALQCVWVINGSIEDEFYVVDKDGVVDCIDRGAL